MRPTHVLIAFVVVSTLLILWSHILRSRWTSASKLRSFLLKGSVSAATLIYLFLLLEIVFYSCVVVSDGFGFTLASRRWFDTYWHPINSFGYRDVEHGAADFEGKQAILVVGDSFVAGHGIARIQDRFPDTLQRNLGNSYIVLNIAKNGWNTAAEYGAIVTYPHKPQRIVLSYYVNDIQGATPDSASALSTPRPQPDLIRYVVDRSYFVNFCYWRWYVFHHRDLWPQYWAYLKQSFADPDVWRAHETQLEQIVAHTRTQSIDLSVIVFPNLMALQDSVPLVSKVAGVFRKHGVPVLDVGSLVAGRDPATLVVSSWDVHPNEALHREIAARLTTAIQAKPW